MSEIRTWLDGIGLAQYANAFEANDIDLDLLGVVDDHVLKDIGVSSAGHRLRIRNAIAKLTPGVGVKSEGQLEEAKPSVTDHSLAHVSDTAQVQASGERRHVVVMFCDLVELDRHNLEARRRRMARSGRGVCRRRFGGGH